MENKSINSITLGELGRHKLEKTVNLKILNCWARLISWKKEKIALALYHQLKDLYDKDEYKYPWLKCIKITLDEINQSYLWNESPENIDHVQLKSLFDKELKSKYSQQWLDQMQTTSACSTYSIFKQNLQFEPYLIKLEPSLVIPLCKFRCINHRLPVVAGRYSKGWKDMQFMHRWWSWWWVSLHFQLQLFW